MCGWKVCHAVSQKNVRCRKLILGRDISRGCRCAIQKCDLHLTFDLA